MLKYTKEQLKNRKLRQAVGITVIVTVVIAAIFVTISVVNDNPPEFNNNFTSESR